jgi:spore coat polysaccharide biosynthesis protein SpsF
MRAAIIQARTGSSRLPAKVLANILGKPLLVHVINRVKASKLVESVVIATTTNEADRVICKIAEENAVACFMGSEEDVLDRYYQAATKSSSDPIVRITADCPLIDPCIIDVVVRCYIKGDCDYAANTLKPTYPDGLDVEVFGYEALERAWKEARWASEREHVTAYIRNNGERFRLVNVENSADLSHFRWTVDEEKDLKFVREVYKRLYKEGQIFYMGDILELLRKYPALEQINQGIRPNEGYLKSLREDRIVK